jgi:advillin
MIVHAGGKASGFRNRNDEDEIDDDGVRLYHVKGTSPTDTYASYVAEEASSLNSQDCFVVCKDDLDGEEGAVYLWEGSCSLPAERDVAASIATILAEGKVSLARTTEGEEPPEFWDAIGGAGDYPKQRPEDPQPSEPRLFQCSDALGEMSVNEVSPFTQDDLDTSDVMILDCGTSIYVWVGSHSNEDEQKAAMDIGVKYAAERSGEADNIDVPVAAVRAGSEPPFFTQHFVGWDPRFLEQRGFVDPLLAKEEKNRQQEEEEEAAAAAKDGDADPEPAHKEEGHDPTKMEETLTDKEFVETFGMGRDAFYELKQWKQNQLKKSAGLF